MNNPCKYCDNKGCGSYHDECEKYQEFSRKQNMINQKRRLDNQLPRSQYLKKDAFRARAFKRRKV